MKDNILLNADDLYKKSQIFYEDTVHNINLAKTRPKLELMLKTILAKNQISFDKFVQKIIGRNKSDIFILRSGELRFPNLKLDNTTQSVVLYIIEREEIKQCWTIQILQAR